MILITYDRDPSTGLYSFIIRQNGETRTRTDPQYPTEEMAKEVAHDCSVAIRKGNGSPEQLKEIINKHEP